MTHIDDWFVTAMCSRDATLHYAAFFLHHKRLSAVAQNCFHKYVGHYKLFCTYKGKRYRCTGASRLGDVWLHSDLTQEDGYELRIDVADCTQWSSEY